jgi:DNA modification methylase
MILFGHGCVEAAKQLRLGKVPTLMLSGLTPEKKRALVIADNKLAEKSVWDMDVLKVELAGLINLDFDVELTGFSTGEIDLIIGNSGGEADATVQDDSETLEIVGPAVSKIGDIWNLSDHRLICGDARAAETFQLLLGDDRAQMVVTDPPYNVKVKGHARGRGSAKQREFAMASGEMSSPGFSGFLETVMNRAIQFSQRASIHYWFIDWRHLREMLRASAPLYSEWKNLLVWRKSNAGQGSFYRSQHELIAVFKAGAGQHINNFGLGSEGRRRTNVLDYPGGSTLSPTRQEELEMHPTVKPVPLIADLMLDCSKRNGIVLDLFGGSGTAILAAEQTGRRARVIEIDPLYVDLAVRRWQDKTGKSATHGPSGRSFDKMVKARHGK